MYRGYDSKLLASIVVCMPSVPMEAGLHTEGRRVMLMALDGITMRFTVDLSKNPRSDVLQRYLDIPEA